MGVPGLEPVTFRTPPTEIPVSVLYPNEPRGLELCPMSSFRNRILASLTNITMLCFHINIVKKGGFVICKIRNKANVIIGLNNKKINVIYSVNLRFYC